MPAINLNQKNFKKEISNGVTLVDFWAEWCPPCKMQGPIIEDLANEIGKKATIAKIDVDTEQAIAQEFGIRSIPTLILFKDGKVLDKMVGVQMKQSLKEKIDNLL